MGLQPCCYCQKECHNGSRVCDFCQEMTHELAGRAMAVLLGRVDWKLVSAGLSKSPNRDPLDVQEEFEEEFERTMHGIADMAYRQADIMLSTYKPR